MTTVGLTLLTLFLAGLFATPAFAGKSWSDQYFSEDKGVVIIGNDDKFATVYGIGLTDKRKLWQARVAKSRNVSVTMDENVAYLVASEDMGFEDNVVAHDIASNKKAWSRKIKNFTRKSKVFTDENVIYFAAEVPYRTVTKFKVFAINKADGKDAWEPFSVTGRVNDMVEDEGGNFVLVAETFERNQEGRNDKAVKLLKIDRATGKTAWDRKLEGSLPYPVSVKSDRIFYLARMKTGDTSNDALIVVDAKTGADLWRHELEPGTAAFSEPEFVDGGVLLLTNRGDLSFVADNGEGQESRVQWELKTGETPVASPKLMSGKMVFLTSSVADKAIQTKVWSVDVKTGQKLWDYLIAGIPELPVANSEKAIVLAIPESVMVKTEKGGEKKEYTLRIAAINPEDGKELWSAKEAGRSEKPLLIKDDKVYAFIYGKKAEENKETPIHWLHAFDLEKGSKLWSAEDESSINTSLYFTSQGIAYGTGDGFVSAVSITDGKRMFKVFTGTENEMDSGIAEKDGLLGFATQNGNYFIIDSHGKVQKRMLLKPLFAMHKLPIFVSCLLLSSVVSWFIYQSRKGKDMFIRRIAGLSAIDEAVGRSTEMGKPVLYITGLADVDEIQTLASLSILGHIAQKTAEYDTPLIVPCCRSVVMGTAQEVVKEAYLKVGRPDTFRRENIHYLTDDQFGYVAGVDGIMIREKPAANFYMGKFYAESLILAETGHSTGAIQIAGTAEASQLPFFVAACDYTLIGEELLAASAYLSNDPLQIGSLKGQDMAKAIILVTILLGCLMATFGYDWVKLLFTTS